MTKAELQRQVNAVIAEGMYKMVLASLDKAVQELYSARKEDGFEDGIARARVFILEAEQQYEVVEKFTEEKSNG
ncbi:MAG: hypothetical protein WC455_25625 [Dehalococcoidia bacterium]|jgi:hypothetical protein